MFGDDSENCRRRREPRFESCTASGIVDLSLRERKIRLAERDDFIMATSKDAILAAVRRNRPAEAPLPELTQQWTTYPDPRAKFIEVLEAVGGRAILARDIADLNEQLKTL